MAWICFCKPLTFVVVQSWIWKKCIWGNLYRIADLCDASVWHAGINSGGALKIQTHNASSTCHPIYLRCLHNVRSHDVSIFSALLGFFGGFAFSPTTYFVSWSPTCFIIYSTLYYHICFLLANHPILHLLWPCFIMSEKINNFQRLILLILSVLSPQLPSIMWLMIYRPSRLSWSWIVNWVIFLFSCLQSWIDSIP